MQQERFDETFLRETRGDSWVDGVKQMARNYSAQFIENEKLTKNSMSDKMNMAQNRKESNF